jgi:phage shock protein PspC (stress-responsive transcriptional regulator)
VNFSSKKFKGFDMNDKVVRVACMVGTLVTMVLLVGYFVIAMLQVATSLFGI